MEFESKNTKFLFIVFAFIVIILYVLTSDILFLKSYNIMNKITLSNRIASDKLFLLQLMINRYMKLADGLGNVNII